jgi:cobalt-zinc-cadmium efflux system outer membrane protein
MDGRNPAVALLFGLTAMAGSGWAQVWTESSVVAKFLEQSPYVREARARAASVQAAARGRTLYANPALNYSREGAGLTEFFQAEQTLSVSGRRRLLQLAGDSAVKVVEAEGAFDLWQARSDLRLAFYQTLAAQQRADLVAAGLQEIEEVIRVLRTREQQGEGSRFDLLRMERERAELQAELTLLRAESELERARLLAFLPQDTNLASVTGQIETALAPLDEANLLQRALNARQDYRAEQRRLEQYRFEQQAAARLKVPEPVVSAGLKRADVGLNRIATGAVVGVSIPLPVFNKGQTEAALYSAEQDRTEARLQRLARNVRAAVEGYARAFNVRVQARDRYQQELAGTGPALVRIATVAYQEGEIGILQLLDAYRSQRQTLLRMLEIQSAVKQAQIELERVVGEELGQ